MKVMYVSSGAKDHESLMLEREITELQRRSIAVSGEPVSFQFYPDLPVESLPLELVRCQPDVLHISAHGNSKVIGLRNEANQTVVLTSQILRAFLDVERPPRLVYLNACNSESLACDLAKVVPIAIGTTAPITNQAAIASVVLFYDRLLSGMSVARAFEAGNRMIQTLQSEAGSNLFWRKDIDPVTERLHWIPRLLARFYKDDPTPNRQGWYGFELGVLGCRQDTYQIVWFTDDESYRDAKISERCVFIEGTPARGVVWSDDEWPEYGDIRIFAAATTAGGSATTIMSTLSEALETKYLYVDNLTPDALPPEAQRAIRDLRENDGSGFSFAMNGKPIGKNAVKKPKRKKKKKAKAKS